MRGIGFCLGVADGLMAAVRVETTAVATTAALLEALMLYKRWDLCFGSSRRSQRFISGQL